MPAVADCCSKSFVFTSPNVVNYQDYEKDCIHGGGAKLCMPVWTEDEIMFAVKKKLTSITKKQAKKRFSLVNGIPRYVFSSEDPKTLVDEAIFSCSNASKLIDMLSEYRSGIAAPYSHKLIKLVPDSDFLYKHTSLDFLSSYVQGKLVEKSMKYAEHEFIGKLSQLDKGNLFASFRGHCFESFAHCRIRAGGTFKVRRIDVNSPVSRTLTIPKFKEQVVFYDLKKVVNNNVYYKPWSRTFAAVDAISLPDKTFQMTVSENHDEKYEGIMKIKEKLKEFKLYFVVPEDIFENFKEQNYVKKKKVTDKQAAKLKKSVQQWALCVPT